MLKLYDLSVEYRSNPLGMDDIQPRFSWKLESDLPNTRQTAYQIRVSNGACLWDSGRVDSGQSILNEYLGPAFEPSTHYEWEVTVWTEPEQTASASAHFETGLLRGTAFEGQAKYGQRGNRKPHFHQAVHRNQAPGKGQTICHRSGPLRGGAERGEAG